MTITPRSTALPTRNLDVLRACAVLAVWTGHLIQTLRQQIGDGGLGRLGVLAFFVHTSLVLMASLERGGTGDGWIRRFYVRRAARIYPLVWATVALCVIASLPYSTIAPGGVEQLARGVAHSGRAVVANLLLVQNVANAPSVLAPLWSLPLEAQMYLILPACYLLTLRGLRSVFVGYAVALIAGVVWFAPLPGIWRLSVLGFAPCFFGGVLAFAVLRCRPSHRIPAALWPVAILAWGAIGIALHPMRFGVGWGLCFALALLIPSWSDLRATWFTAGAKVISKYSYGIYLLHMPAWSLAFDVLDAPRAVQITAYVIALVGLPVLAYHLIEYPVIEWARTAAFRDPSARQTSNSSADPAGYESSGG